MWIEAGAICEACALSTTGFCAAHTPQVTVTINPMLPTLPSMTFTPFPFVRQGWQCPLCRIVHAPDVLSCPCTHALLYSTTTTSLAPG